MNNIDKIKEEWKNSEVCDELKFNLEGVSRPEEIEYRQNEVARWWLSHFSELLKEREECDCHLHENQVCDICQKVTGEKKDVVVEETEDWVKSFRRMIAENDDKNSNSGEKILDLMPFKGDIYFDGIETEKFISNLLSHSKEEVRKEIEKLIKRHKDKACIIADSSEYDEVNMAKFVENPLIRHLVFQHIDSVRELEACLSIINKYKNNG
jgi:hypothetical protein